MSTVHRVRKDETCLYFANYDIFSNLHRLLFSCDPEWNRNELTDEKYFDLNHSTTFNIPVENFESD